MDKSGIRTVNSVFDPLKCLVIRGPGAPAALREVRGQGGMQANVAEMLGNYP